MNKVFRFAICLALLTALLFPLPASAEDAAAPAEDLSQYLLIDQGNHGSSLKLLVDGKLENTARFKPFETIRLSWPDAPETPSYLCMQWGALPDRVILRQEDESGAILAEEIAEALWDAIIPLSPDAVGVTIIANATGMELGRVALFGEGTLPSPFFAWKDTPRGMDYLVIATHPDDDVLFMGGIVPVYGAEQGYVGTIAYVTIPSRLRVNEATLGAHEMGAVYRPLFLGFTDIRQTIREQYENLFLEDTVTLSLVRLLREYRPLVVFSHDLKGEYGHWQHQIVAASVCNAVRLCADPDYDPISCAQFGTWEVRKCYLHLYPENVLTYDIGTPLASMGGRTALEVAQDAFLMHRSQLGGRHFVQSETDSYPLNRFGMVYGTVDAGFDAFDNIDPTLFASYEPPEPSPEPSPVPTAKPTAVQTATPKASAPPVSSRTTAAPAKSASSEPKTDSRVLPVILVLAGVIVAFGGFLLILRRRKRR